MKSMEKQTNLIFLVLGIFLLFGCSEASKDLNSALTIKVEGSKGQSFRVNYSIIGTGAICGPTNVYGTVPAEYSGKGSAVTCHFQKTSQEGYLRVKILKNDKLISHSETSIPYGVISLKSLP